ncbi:hypothetical protein [Streptomyces lancefieldiae]|uniref:hypothetical protein n=1 Tax=Streptomyces lancefieldiae TaxID=3075520 RepID=UPI00374E092A
MELTLAEFGSRAVYDSGRSLTGRTIRLTDFVTHGDDGTWYITRLQVPCCAADASTGKAEIRRAGAPVRRHLGHGHRHLAPGGRTRLGRGLATCPRRATDVRRGEQPANPYEKR